MKYSGLLLLIGSLIFAACSPPLSEEEKKVIEFENEMTNDPSAENVTKYLAELTKFISNNKEDSDKIKPLLEKGAQVALEHKQGSRGVGFLQALIKDYPEDEANKDRLWTLAGIMDQLRKPHAAKTLYAGFVKSYPDDKRNNEAQSIYAPLFTDVDSFVNRSFNQVLEEPDQFGLNRTAALKYVDVIEAYALSQPNANATPEYLYKAAEIARSIKTFQKSLNLYDWILEKYPNFEKAPTVLFIKGFVLEDELGQMDLARSVYEEFLQKYPDHQMASSVKFLIENLGKSDEEILEFIEQKRATENPAQ